MHTRTHACTHARMHARVWTMPSEVDPGQQSRAPLPCDSFQLVNHVCVLLSCGESVMDNSWLAREMAVYVSANREYCNVGYLKQDLEIGVYFLNLIRHD